MAGVDLERAKKIKLYKNGDPKFLGKEIVLNRRKIRTWDSFLNTATVGLKANYPVRAICTPNQGHRVQSLDDFEDNKQYVALGYGKFRNIGYTELENQQPRKDHSPPRARQLDLSAFPTELKEVRPVEHSKRYQQTSGRFRKVPTDVLTIFIYANGQELEAAKRLTLTHAMMRNWEGILSMITERVNLRSGAARRVYTVQGELVTDPRQFENGASYIAVGSDIGGLKILNYGQARPEFHTSPKGQRNYIRRYQDVHRPQGNLQIQINYPRFGGSKNRRSRASDNSHADSSATDGTLNGTSGRGFALGASGGRNSHGPSPASDRTPQPRASRPTQKKPPPGRRPPAAQQEDPFHAKPVKHQHKGGPREVDLNANDPDGVFKARGVNRETSGARQVEDTRDTQVDLPIDQIEAEEVKDEIIDMVDERTKRTPSPQLQRTPTPRRLTPLDRTPTPQRQMNGGAPSHRTPTPRQLTPLTARTITPVRQRSPSPPPQSTDRRTPTPPPQQRSPTPVTARDRTPSPAPRGRSPTPPPQHHSPTPPPRERTPTPPPKERTPSPPPQQRSPTPPPREFTPSTPSRERSPTPPPTTEEVEVPAENAEQAPDGVQTPHDRTPTPGEDDTAAKNQAATRIQANYKGYRTRKEIQRRKEQKDSAATQDPDNSTSDSPPTYEETANDIQSESRTQTPLEPTVQSDSSAQDVAADIDQSNSPAHDVVADIDQSDSPAQDVVADIDQLDSSEQIETEPAIESSYPPNSITETVDQSNPSTLNEDQADESTSVTQNEGDASNEGVAQSEPTIQEEVDVSTEVAEDQSNSAPEHEGEIAPTEVDHQSEPSIQNEAATVDQSDSSTQNEGVTSNEIAEEESGEVDANTETSPQDNNPSENPENPENTS